MESVLEIATIARQDAREARDSCARCAPGREAAERHGLCIASAGTHPFAMCEDQRIQAPSATASLVKALRFVARQEMIFGLHVHVGIDGSPKAILRHQRHARAHPRPAGAVGRLAVWRAQATARLDRACRIFAHFAYRVGHVLQGLRPNYESRIRFMVESGA